MYGSTYFDTAITPAPVAWQMLRALRHRPPGRAGHGQRRATFDAALEQSEQLFAAAETVGVQSRPLLVFYGLSQAGRAIAAASTAPGGNGDWKLSGHGIRATGLSDASSTGLAAVTVQDQASGSFIRLAETLDAESLPEPTRLGALWPLLPDLGRRFRLPGEGGPVPLSVTSGSAGPGGPTDLTRVRVRPLPMEVAAPAPAEGSGVGWDAGQRDWPGERQVVRQFLDQYPALTGSRFVSPPGNPVGLTGDGLGGLTAELDLPRDAEDRLVDIRNVRWAFPALHGTGRAQHPLLVWWALLYALSMLARYEPRVWADMVSISGSGDAAAIEHLLSQSLVALPELIHRTVMLVAH